MRSLPQAPEATVELPWMVSLQDLQGKHLAFGSFLSEQWLLSKASGLRNSTQVLALASVTGPMGPRSLLLPIDVIIPHKDFDELTLDHNIALLRIAAPIQIDETVWYICFPYPNFPPEALQDCWVVGWLHPQTGSSSPQKLLVEDVDPCPLHRTMATECCSHREGDNVSGCLGYPGNSVVCQAQGTGQWVLKGMLTDGGARCYGPFLYTRVAYYSDWIMATTSRWGSPVFPIPLRRHFASQAEHRQEMVDPFIDEEDLGDWEAPSAVSEDLPGLNGTDWLNASNQGPIESRAKSAPIYYDYYSGETYPISTAALGQLPWGTGGIFSAGFLLHCLTWWVTVQGPD
ncbi:inactive serine protease 54 isoform X2 [Sceloporus undulatus]|nr:inactive serine protease 54 isoform X2 [Sceloporus undulatus]